MGLFDWMRGGRNRTTPGAGSDPVWQVAREGDQLELTSSRGASVRLPLLGARAVRIVPLTGWQHHATASSGRWQVALQRPDGDVLVGEALADWRAARELAQRVCDAAGLPLDELTRAMFSRVGTGTSA